VRRGVAALYLVAMAWATGCGGGGGHELRGDQAYGQGRYPEALAEYREAARDKPSASVWAKLGAAALHAGELRESAEAYLHLAEQDRTRADEAAEGLESVARAAERGGNLEILREVVTGLAAAAPGHPTSRYALLLAQRPDVDTAELVALFPGALATANAPGTVDSLLVAYGRALQASAGCGQALLQYRAVLRRSQDSAARAPARLGVADCAYALGEYGDSAGKLQDATLWFAESARMDSATTTGRRALLRYADDRLAQGDTLAAALAFQAVVSGAVADSTGTAAARRLAALGISSSAGDSARTGPR
jgi:tetratricopeptide (TPR) repeat protein